MRLFFRATCVGVLGAFVASVGFLACGSSDDASATSDSGTPDGNAGSDGSPAKGDGGDAGDAGSFGSTMIIGLSQSSPDLYTLLVDFTSGPLPCVMSVTGACGLTICTYPAPSADGGTTSPFVAPNAGDITVTGVRDAGAVVLTYGPVGDAGAFGYVTQSANALFFQGGDTVTAIGAGGPGLGAFPLQSVVAPDAIVLTSPVCTASSCADLDRTTDLAVAWTGGGNGMVQAFFESVVATASATTITAVDCDFDAAAGMGTVPSAILMNLSKTGDPGVFGSAESFLPVNEGAFTVGATAASLSLQGQGQSKVTMTVSK